MNAEIGKNVNNIFSLHNSSNKNGEHLTDFTLEYKLTCLNTKFQKCKWKLWIYAYANDAQEESFLSGWFSIVARCVTWVGKL